MAKISNSVCRNPLRMNVEKENAVSVQLGLVWALFIQLPVWLPVQMELN